MSIEQAKPEIPAPLANELRGLYRTPVALEARVDEAVLAAARDRAAAAGRRRLVIRRMTRWGLVAAAGLAVGVSLTAMFAWPSRSARPTLAEDVNGDGVVDILDALALERAVEGRSATTKWDLNGDGAVNRADVDRIAMVAVRLVPKGGGHG